MATKPEGEAGTLFGLALPQFYMALAGVYHIPHIFRRERRVNTAPGFNHGCWGQLCAHNSPPYCW